MCLKLMLMRNIKSSFHLNQIRLTERSARIPNTSSAERSQNFPAPVVPFSQSCSGQYLSERVLLSNVEKPLRKQKQCFSCSIIRFKGVKSYHEHMTKFLHGQQSSRSDLYSLIHNFQHFIRQAQIIHIQQKMKLGVAFQIYTPVWKKVDISEIYINIYTFCFFFCFAQRN